jgi:hypothetical protein
MKLVELLRGYWYAIFALLKLFCYLILEYNIACFSRDNGNALPSYNPSKHKSASDQGTRSSNCFTCLLSLRFNTVISSKIRPRNLIDSLLEPTKIPVENISKTQETQHHKEMGSSILPRARKELNIPGSPT